MVIDRFRSIEAGGFTQVQPNDGFGGFDLAEE